MVSRRYQLLKYSDINRGHVAELQVGLSIVHRIILGAFFISEVLEEIGQRLEQDLQVQDLHHVLHDLRVDFVADSFGLGIFALVNIKCHLLVIHLQ